MAEQLCFTPSLGLLKVGCLLRRPTLPVAVCILFHCKAVGAYLVDTSGQATGINMKTLDLDLAFSGSSPAQVCKGTWVSILHFMDENTEAQRCSLPKVRW